MGHAYYANYLLWLEQARGAWCRDRGFTYKQLEEMGFKLPVVEVWLRYKGEVKYDDLVIVRVSLDEVSRAALKFGYTLLVGEKVVTEGYTWHVFMGENRKAVTVPPHVREMLAREPGDFETLG